MINMNYRYLISLCDKRRHQFTIIYVVVNFLSQVIFLFLLFLGTVVRVVYANEVETKEKEKLLAIKN